MKYQVKQRIAVITLNRQDTRNTIDEVMVSELLKAFNTSLRDTNVKAVVLKADGEIFSASTDQQYIENISKSDFNQSLSESAELVKLFQLMYTMRKPVIALVQGEASSTGCGLLAACDLVFAARETATFGFPEVQSGYIPAIPLVFLSRRIGEIPTREFILCGRKISAEEAGKLQLVNFVVPAIELEEQGMKFAQELITKNSPSALGLVKELLSRIHGMSMTDALDYAGHLHAVSRMTEDCKKGIQATLNGTSIEW
jgi:methylglutaconyl-CoA hydratase